MVSEKVQINNPSGLHLRPAGILCKEAMKYKSLITFEYAGGTANAKSVLSVLGACVKCGDEIELVCEGEDEEKALETLVALIEEIRPSAAFRLSSKLIFSQSSRYPDSNSICWEDSVSTDKSAIVLDSVFL